MKSRYEQHGLVWIDLESPTTDDVREIVAEFDIAPHIVEELLIPSGKPRAEMCDQYLYVILHFPALRHSHSMYEQEVDFVIGRDFIITAHTETIDPLHKFSKIFEVNSILERHEIGDHAGFLFFFILKKLYKAVEHELEYIRRSQREIEEHVFSGHEASMVAAISHSARDLLNLRQTIEPHYEVLHTLESEGTRLFGDDFLPYLRALSNEYYRVHTRILRESESLHELRESNNSLLTTKQNETMKRFTILAFFTFPLSLIAMILNMDSIHNPIHGQPYDFWIVIGILCMTAGSMWLYFKHKQWL
jgi:magnesium transporter